MKLHCIMPCKKILLYSYFPFWVNGSVSINVRTHVRRSCGGPIDQEERGGGVLHNQQSLNGK